MPIREILGEMILRPLLEVVLYGLSYWTGAVVLTVVSAGKLRLAPLDSVSEKNPGKERWYQVDWGLWLRRRGKARMLKAECVCLVGFLVWAVVGLVIYFLTRTAEA